MGLISIHAFFLEASEILLLIASRILFSPLCFIHKAHKHFNMHYFCVESIIEFIVTQGGLQEVADQLDLQRIGRQHQAGSDSLLTGMAFFRMKEVSSCILCLVSYQVPRPGLTINSRN